ncbi:rhodanese-like domain-containing protein [Kangiella marina]|uniref:Rhodanese domain-containing protein n=1 Tax=Kangiella marina TaxID=1079178 RepID=A0ABP8IJH4_9GAMM
MAKFVAEESEAVQFIEPQQLAVWLKQSDAPLVINVTGDEQALDESQLVADKSLSTPITEFANLINELDPDEPVVIVCQLGQKSFNAAHRLIESDYSCVYSLHGGLEAWLRQRQRDR